VTSPAGAPSRQQVFPSAQSPSRKTPAASSADCLGRKPTDGPERGSLVGRHSRWAVRWLGVRHAFRRAPGRRAAWCGGAFDEGTPRPRPTTRPRAEMAAPSAGWPGVQGAEPLAERPRAALRLRHLLRQELRHLGGAVSSRAVRCDGGNPVPGPCPARRTAVRSPAGHPTPLPAGLWGRAQRSRHGRARARHENPGTMPPYTQADEPHAEG
jgi:hypothetical protein